MNILVIDGMGGGIGKAVVECLCKAKAGHVITALGINAIATSSMLKAGADHSATGENAIIFNTKKADIIIGSMGIVLANSMLGEVSPRIARAVSSSNAEKILIPTSKCSVSITGLRDQGTAQHIEEIPELIKKILEKK